MENLKGFYMTKTAIWDFKSDHWVCRAHPIFSVNGIIFPLSYFEYILTMAQNSDFHILAFPIGHIGGLR